MNTWTDDKLDMLICLAARNCGNDDVEAFDNTDTSDTKLSRGFYARARRTVSRYRHRTMLKTLHRVSVRIAVALMALMSLCGRYRTFARLSEAPLWSGTTIVFR